MIISSAFIPMGPNLLIITRFGPIGINAENYHPIIHIIERVGPNYYVRKGTIISSGFIIIVMDPSLVITTDYRGWSHY